MGLRRRPGRDDRQPERSAGRTPAPQGRLDRTVRGLRPDRNPLRRTTDRLETCLLAGLFIAAAAGAPLAAEAASHAAYEAALHAQQEQLATRHQVPAVLTAPAGGISGYSLDTDVPAQATWTAGGAHRSGQVPAQPGSPAGTRVNIWTDGSGNLTSPPLTAGEIAGQADMSMVGALVGVGVAYLGGTAAIRLVLYRRRMAAWEADWLTTARTWNRQSW